MIECPRDRRSSCTSSASRLSARDPSSLERDVTERKAIWAVMLVASALLFSLMLAALQVREVGWEYLVGGDQLKRHRAVLEGTSIDPWQYRVLSEYAVEGALRLARHLPVAQPDPVAFVALRVLQNLVLLLLAAVYYRKLGLSRYLALLGMSLLAWGMSFGFHDADLQFNTYSDVIFYLLAALAILGGRILWILPIAGLAAANRETSLLIPFMTLAEVVPHAKGRARKALFVAAGSLVLSASILIAIRLAYGPRPHGMTAPIGLSLLLYNLGRPQSWVFLFATFGLLPIMALMSAAAWPPAVRANFWAIVPVWLVVHSFSAVIAETRLFLVPHALVIIPGSLFGIAYWGVLDPHGGEQPRRAGI